MFTLQFPWDLVAPIVSFVAPLEMCAIFRIVLECKEQSIHSQSERRPGQASHGTRHPLSGNALNPIGPKRTLSENADPTANSHLLLDVRTPPLRRHLNQHFRSTPSLAIMAAVNKIALNSPSRQNPSELETAIAGALFDLESNTQDLKATLRPLQFASAREVRLGSYFSPSEFSWNCVEGIFYSWLV